MANTLFQLKRSSVAGKVPNTATLSIGELGVNLTDQILYTSNGSAVFEIGANNTNSQITGTLTVNSISANGSLGSDGQVLTSNGSVAYWSTSSGSGTVTSVATGDGLSGGPITSTGTISVLANSGITANSSGTFVNSAYIATIASNSATYANSSVTNTFTVGTASYFVANGNVGIGTSSPATKLHVSGSDGITSVLFSGNTRAARFIADTNGATLEGVDNTGFTSYQPLSIGGSTVFFTISGLEKMRISSAGNVGINTSSPSYPLDVDGNINSSNTIFAVHFDNISDISFKDNIKSLKNSKEIINQLNPVSFTWKETGEKSFGLIAQETEKILPEIVHKKQDDTKTISYIQLIPFLIQVIKDQQQQIDLINNKLDIA